MLTTALVVFRIITLSTTYRIDKTKMAGNTASNLL